MVGVETGMGMGRGRGRLFEGEGGRGRREMGGGCGRGWRGVLAVLGVCCRQHVGLKAAVLAVRMTPKVRTEIWLDKVR